MRIPVTPPDVGEILKAMQRESSLDLTQLWRMGISPAPEGKYLHWHKLRYHQPPENLTHKQWWAAVKLTRQVAYIELPCWDKSGAAFQYANVDPIPKRLHQIDLLAGGRIEGPSAIINPGTRDRYYINSLIEEAITSSQLEGAGTTRAVAENMIRTQRRPRDKGEQMIFNNFLAMKRLRKLKNQPLSVKLVMELHRILTEDTLEDPRAAGRFRKDSEEITVSDNYGNVLHVPPAAATLESRLESLCEFANDSDPDPFIHPVVRAIVLHFWLAYDHPFVDGNGRTARALFYWSMLRSGYWLMEFVSISRVILKSPGQYVRAYLYTETDENDATYFILYHLQVIQRAINELNRYLQEKSREVERLEKHLKASVELNYRQRALISHALRHSHQDYTIESHRLSHNVAYETARQDLLDLSVRGLLVESKIGRTRHFRPISELADRLADME